MPTIQPNNRSVSVNDFQQRYADNEFNVSQLKHANRTKSVSSEDADLNKDGKIAGNREMGALFHEMTDGKDRFELSKSKRQFGFFGPMQTAPTKEAGVMQALDNFANASANPAPGTKGHDPFQPTHMVASGRFKGEPINHDLQRSVVALSPAQAAQYGAKPGELAFANVSHNGQHYVAVVPEDAVKKASLMLEHFPAPVPAAHSMIRFQMKEGKEARLVPQKVGSEEETIKQNDLVLSIEASGPRNFKYDLLEGAKSNFSIAYRFESLQDRALHTQKNGNRVEQLPLKLTDSELQRVLKEAVRTSDQTKQTAMYNTLTRNCTNETFHILDRGIGIVGPKVHAARALTAETLPPLSEFYLSIRGLMDKSTSMPDLADEFASAQP